MKSWTLDVCNSANNFNSEHFSHLMHLKLVKGLDNLANLDTSLVGTSNLSLRPLTQRLEFKTYLSAVIT